ncbi:IclR family transcriptional regulator C-terminal domain-containing protein [Aeromicrobium sp. UC242_57]|uniref:IclR family transcriptional regulator domain-containing protein n=1 Tax=Aeromicrobium sp. UC242_57 TaxID=3374624 RepID=UPI0037A50FAE
MRGTGLRAGARHRRGQPDRTGGSTRRWLLRRPACPGERAACCWPWRRTSTARRLSPLSRSWRGHLTRSPTSSGCRLSSETIREAQLSFDRQEFEIGIDCIAVPIFDDGRVQACITVSIPSQRFDERRDDVVAVLRQVAQQHLG